MLVPTTDGALWYRFPPHPGDSKSCIFDMGSLGRFAPGLAPVSNTSLQLALTSLRAVIHLEEELQNRLAVQASMRSRGWQGALLNLVQETRGAKFLRTLEKYDGD